MFSDVFGGESPEFYAVRDTAFEQRNIQCFIAREEKNHSIVSGNKLHKLRLSLDEIESESVKRVLTFGGARSNHLHALAYASYCFNFELVAMVRGHAQTTTTLRDCVAWGAQSHFLNRRLYKHRSDLLFVDELMQRFNADYYIPEGGCSDLGVKGVELWAKALFSASAMAADYLFVSVGTGTTLAGFINSAPASCRVVGINAVKGNAKDIEASVLSQVSGKKNWCILHDYHHGGFAKTSGELNRFSNDWKVNQSVELDRVYTRKMMYAIYDLVAQGKIQDGANILAVHTGGLQGNRER